MAVPRNRNSNARKNTRRAHHAKTKKSLATCTSCGVAKMAHVACPSCGIYRGRQIVNQEKA